ncbi:MAG: hypothetical protein MZV65_44830 [Chromatiales bacterium]|nr:hypothetical protein [Chromatiales bacterium]
MQGRTLPAGCCSSTPAWNSASLLFIAAVLSASATIRRIRCGFRAGRSAARVRHRQRGRWSGSCSASARFDVGLAKGENDENFSFHRAPLVALLAAASALPAYAQDHAVLGAGSGRQGSRQQGVPVEAALLALRGAQLPDAPALRRHAPAHRDVF